MKRCVVNVTGKTESPIEDTMLEALRLTGRKIADPDPMHYLAKAGAA